MTRQMEFGLATATVRTLNAPLYATAPVPGHWGVHGRSDQYPSARRPVSFAVETEASVDVEGQAYVEDLSESW